MDGRKWEAWEGGEQPPVNRETCDVQDLHLDWLGSLSARHNYRTYRTPEAPIYGCPRYWGFEGPKSALSLSEFWGFEGKIAQTLSVFGDLRLIWDALDPVHGPKII